MQKLITLPEKMLEVIARNEQGILKTTGEKVNAFIDCANTLLENMPSKNETDVYLTRSIREKIDECVKTQSTNILLEESEITHIQNMFKAGCDKGMIIGSKWYDFIVPLREAKKLDAKKKD
jgi:hypothetical protein